jgi:hypothetical protein
MNLLNRTHTMITYFHKKTIVKFIVIDIYVAKLDESVSHLLDFLLPIIKIVL